MVRVQAGTTIIEITVHVSQMEITHDPAIPFLGTHKGLYTPLLRYLFTNISALVSRHNN